MIRYDWSIMIIYDWFIMSICNWLIIIIYNQLIIHDTICYKWLIMFIHDQLNMIIHDMIVCNYLQLIDFDYDYLFTIDWLNWLIMIVMYLMKFPPLEPCTHVSLRWHGVSFCWNIENLSYSKSTVKVVNKVIFDIFMFICWNNQL